jgi:cytochrome c
VDKKSVGPSYQDIANRYKGNAEAPAKLAEKIIKGGGGVWGEHAMSAHPQISANDAATMVKYILSMGEKPLQVKSFTTAGTQTLKVPEGENGRGSYVIRAAYTDRGTKVLSPLMSEQILHLRNPALDPAKADVSKGTELLITPSKSFNVIGNGSYFGFRQLDLTGVQQVEILAQATKRAGAVGGVVEVRLDSPTGKLIGTTNAIVVNDPSFGPPLTANTNTQQQRPANAQAGGTAPAAGQQRRPQGGRMSQQAVTKIEATTGKHDVYFVFKNPDAQPNQIVMSVNVVQFQNK